MSLMECKEPQQLMRPLDIYSEKSSLRDGSPDKGASNALVHEAHSLTLQKQSILEKQSQVEKQQQVLKELQVQRELQLQKELQQKQLQMQKQLELQKQKQSQKDEPGFDSAVGFGKRDQMALASLAFCSPLMMMGMGAALGLSDNMRLSKEQALKDAPVRRARQGALERAVPKEKTLLSMPTESVLATRMNFRPEATRKSKLEFKNRQENVLYPSHGAWRQPDPERSWVKASKLVKRKQQMMDQLAKCRGLLQLNVVSAILSKIERLDKELKKMGC